MLGRGKISSFILYNVYSQTTMTKKLIQPMAFASDDRQLMRIELISSTIKEIVYKVVILFDLVFKSKIDLKG